MWRAAKHQKVIRPGVPAEATKHQKVTRPGVPAVSDPSIPAQTRKRKNADPLDIELEKAAAVPDATATNKRADSADSKGKAPKKVAAALPTVASSKQPDRPDLRSGTARKRPAVPAAAEAAMAGPNDAGSAAVVHTGFRLTCCGLNSSPRANEIKDLFPEGPGQKVVLGRQTPGLNVLRSDDHLSRKHFELEWSADGQTLVLSTVKKEKATNVVFAVPPGGKAQLIGQNDHINIGPGWTIVLPARPGLAGYITYQDIPSRSLEAFTQHCHCFRVGARTTA